MKGSQPRCTAPLKNAAVVGEQLEFCGKFSEDQVCSLASLKKAGYPGHCLRMLSPCEAGNRIPSSYFQARLSKQGESRVNCITKQPK